MKNILLASAMLLSIGASAQILGDTRATIINDFRNCEIYLNEPLYIVFNCGNNTNAFFFDENGLTYRSLVKMSAKDCEELKQVVIAEGATHLNTNARPSPFGYELPGFDGFTTASTYLLRGTIYNFYAGDLYGKNPEKYGSMEVKKYEP